MIHAHSPGPARRRFEAGLRALLLLAVVAAGFVTPASAVAQGWDVPRLLGPLSPVDRGVLYVAFPEDEGGGEGVLATWRAPSWHPGLSVRVGGAFRGDQDRGFGGIDFRAPVYVGESTVVWSSGLGFALGRERLRVALPLQLSATRVWSTGNLWTAPYVSAGASAEWRDDGDGDEVEEFEVHPVVELGLDLTVDPNRRWVIRGGIGLLGRKGAAVGLAFPH